MQHEPGGGSEATRRGLLSASARRALAVSFLKKKKNSRRCENVEIAQFAISKGGGRRSKTRRRAWISCNARREFSTGVHRPAFPQRSSAAFVCPVLREGPARLCVLRFLSCRSCPSGFSPLVLLSCAAPLLEAGEQLLLGGLHLHSCGRVGLGAGLALQILDGHRGLEMSSYPG